MNAAIPIILLIALLAFLFFVLWLLYRFIRYSIRKLQLELTFSLIGLGLAMLVFPDVLTQFVKGLINLFLGVITEVGNLSFAGADDWTAAIARLSDNVQQAIDQFFGALDIENLLLFLLVWFLVGYFSDRAYKEWTKPQNKESGEEGVESSLRRKLLVGVVLFAAFYLCLASLIAIPVFQIPTNLESNAVSELRTELQELTISPEQFEKDFLDSSSLIVLNRLKEDTSQTREAAFSRSLYRMGVNSYFNLANRTQRELGRMHSEAVNQFRTVMLQAVPKKQKEKYKIDLSTWYKRSHDRQLRYLEDCKTRLDQDDYLNSVLSLRQVVDDTPTLSMLNAFTGRLAFKYQPPGPLPRKPEPSDNLGIFGIFAKWLVNTPSYAFALIVGLLGFGLLGAAAATYLQQSSKDGNPLDISFHEVGRIIIKGITASVVVFLAVKGGLAIFGADDEEDINAYVLFFAVLVAAVYSDAVWAWARTKLLDLLKKEPEEKSPSPPPPKEESEQPAQPENPSATAESGNEGKTEAEEEGKEER